MGWFTAFEGGLRARAGHARSSTEATCSVYRTVAQARRRQRSRDLFHPWLTQNKVQGFFLDSVEYSKPHTIHEYIPYT